jgi:hypothetical protein
VRPSFIVIVAYLLVVVPAPVNASDKEGQLRQAMADIALLNHQLVQRRSEAVEIRDALAARLETIETEVLRHAREGSIDSEKAALNTPRLRYDLMLIAELEAYIDRYNQKIGYFRLACDRLSYLYQQADDDLKIVTALSGLKVDALISQVEKTIDAYLADSQALVIIGDALNMVPPEKVWQRIHKAI